ncbi:AraC family transcriptional regulator [Mucilaginibacter sp. CAU 1740]|uniref:helix-turn-helix transcriptional regulator n=1 Tax=Mucilaginibacter sp. CAU 1740 TaxID=3140365 RepID=UPI00325B240E
MYISLTPALQTPSITLPYPEGFIDKDCIGERSQKFIFTDDASVKVRENWIEGIGMIQSTYEIKRSIQIDIQCDIPGRYISFITKGKLEFKTSSSKVKIQEGDTYSAYHSHLNTQVSIAGNCSMITFLLTQNFIDKITGNGNFHLNLQQQPDLFRSRVPYIKPISVTGDILNAPHPLYIKRLLLEAKILELITEVHKPATQKDDPGFAFTNTDKARLMEAKKLVEQNIKMPYSLIELSRKTGLNDFKLKKGFKALFGNTVFGYLGELRMDTAYKMLQRGKSVGEVAETVGYKNAHHFTAAFKKRFDLLPSKLDKLILVFISGMLLG